MSALGSMRFLALAAILLAPAAMAKGDHDTKPVNVTLTGTVTAVHQEGFVLNTGSGTQAVEVEPTTVFTDNGQPATLGSLGVGKRVSVTGHFDRTEFEAKTVAIQSVVTLTGALQALSLPNLSVSGKTVSINSSTVITVGGAAASAADLAVGQMVTVTGVLQADGTIMAQSVAVLSGFSVTFTGLIGAITAPDLTVSGTTVHVNSTTVIAVGVTPATLASLLVGQQVTVTGVLQPDGSIVAQKVTAP
jgi:hypothetical protein